MSSDRALIGLARDEAARLGGRASGADGVEPLPRIPGYSIVGEIGRGGQGVVYEAVEERSGRIVALKLMNADCLHHADERARFAREIRILAGLSHENIIAISGSGEAGRRFYYAMERIDGVPIDEFVRTRRPSRAALLELFTRVCDGVHAAHQRGVIHRDLKPGNVLVDAGGCPKVLDFGLARLESLEGDSATASCLTQTGQFLGTLRWSSPEQLSGGARSADVRTDVYALGLLLHELLTGESAHECNAPLGVALQNILHSAPRRSRELRQRLGRDLETIVHRCLAREPARRYASVADLGADVRRHLRGDPIEARRDSRLYVLGRTLCRYRWASSAVGAALVAGVAFGAVMAGMYQDAQRARQSAEQRVVALEDELQRLKKSLLEPTNWTSAFDAAGALAALPPEDGLRVVREAWAQMDDVHRRQQLLKAVSASSHPAMVQLLHLGMTDPTPAVQSWAISYLKDIALRDFSEDFAAYTAWYREFGARPLDDVLRENGLRALPHLAATRPESRGAQLERLASGLRKSRSPHTLLGEHGTRLRDLCLECMRTSRDGERSAAAVIALLRPTEEYLRAHVLPLVAADEPASQAACALLGEMKASWAVQPLLEALTTAVQSERRTLSAVFTPAQALAAIGDARVIPAMIGLIEADNKYETIYGIGYFGLGKLTSVQFDEAHDGAWWREWWEKNRTRFGAEVAALNIPKYDPPKGGGTRMPARNSSASPARGGDPKPDSDVLTQALFAGGNSRMRYFLYGPHDPIEAGPPHTAPAPLGLILVLPGGDGSAEFQPFVRNVYAQSVPRGYLLAQLVAPCWSEKQFESVVWPSAKLPWEGAGFATEAFIRAVIAEVKLRYPIDERRVFVFGWSSGGPPCYAATLETGSPVRGAFVAMSVFKPDYLPALDGAKGKRFYVLHSPTDFIKMSFPEAARDKLAAAGAETRLETYEGGHGWHGDVFGNIRRAIEWLEKPDAANP